MLQLGKEGVGIREKFKFNKITLLVSHKTSNNSTYTLNNFCFIIQGTGKITNMFQGCVFLLRFSGRIQNMDPGMDHPCGPGPWGGPWTGSTGVVHGRGSMFCKRPIYTRQNGFIEFHQKAVRVNMPANITFPGGELSRMFVLRIKCKIRRNETSFIALARVNVHSDDTARMWTR